MTRLLLPAAAALAATVVHANRGNDIPSEYQAGSLAKQMVFREAWGTFMTKMDTRGGEPDPGAHYPGPMGDAAYLGWPFGQVELLAEDCDPKHSGSLLILGSQLETTFGSVLSYLNNVTISVRDSRFAASQSAEALGRMRAQHAASVARENKKASIKTDAKALGNHSDPLLYHRATLLGRLQLDLPTYNVSDPEYVAISECYLKKQPDAREWVGPSFHGFKFYRFIPQHVHYVGGFGNSHFIGWLDVAKNYNPAPDNSLCVNWGSACAATGKEACCPSDTDNHFEECCAREAPAGGFGVVSAGDQTPAVGGSADEGAEVFI